MELRIKKILLDGIEHCDIHNDSLLQTLKEYVGDADWDGVISTVEDIDTLSKERKILLRQLGNL